MPTPARVAAIVAMVEAGDYVEAVETFYAGDATAQENLGRTLRGRPALVENERAALTATSSSPARARSPSSTATAWPSAGCSR